MINGRIASRQGFISIKEKLGYFAFVFVLAFISTAIVTYLYSWIVHGSGAFNWELAVILGIALGVVRAFTKD